MLIPRPLIPEGFSFTDPDCKRIAETVYEEVNTTFYTSLNGKAITSYRTFNDNFIPLIDFPVLKVYKDGEQEYSSNADIMITSFVVSYALAFSQAPKVGDISTFISKEIRRVLKNMSFDTRLQLVEDAGITIDYEDFIDPQSVIYKYTTIRFSMYTSASSICQPEA